MLLEFLQTPDFYTRLYALRLLSAIFNARPERTQECVLNAGVGTSRLAATLDDPRDAVRNGNSPLPPEQRHQAREKRKREFITASEALLTRYTYSRSPPPRRPEPIIPRPPKTNRLRRNFRPHLHHLNHRRRPILRRHHSTRLSGPTREPNPPKLHEPVALPRKRLCPQTSRPPTQRIHTSKATAALINKDPPTAAAATKRTEL